MVVEEDLQKVQAVVLGSLVSYRVLVDVRVQLLPLPLLLPLFSQHLACPGQHLLDLVLATHGWSGSFSGSCRVDPQGEDA